MHFGALGSPKRRCTVVISRCSGIDVAHVLWSLAANAVETAEHAPPVAVRPMGAAVDKLLALLPDRMAQLQPADMANVAVAIARSAAARMGPKWRI